MNLTVVAFIHNCARFFVEIDSELYFSRSKMIKRKKISVEKQAQVIILQKTGKNYRTTAKILEISLCSVHTAIRRYRETGQNTNRKRSGRPRKTNQRIGNKIYAISKGNRQKSASEIRAEINEDLDSPISLTTVKGRLKEKGMIGRIAVRKPLLRPVNKRKRLIRKEDNDPKHTSKFFTSYLERKKVAVDLNIMEWPPQSASIPHRAIVGRIGPTCERSKANKPSWSLGLFERSVE